MTGTKNFSNEIIVHLTHDNDNNTVEMCIWFVLKVYYNRKDLRNRARNPTQYHLSSGTIQNVKVIYTCLYYIYIYNFEVENNFSDFYIKFPRVPVVCY